MDQTIISGALFIKSEILDDHESVYDEEKQNTLLGDYT